MKHAFCVSINMGYMFSLNATMNAMAHYGCHADWEIAYDNVPEDYRKKMSESFPFKVNWTHIPELLEGTKRNADRFWLATWKMTSKALEKDIYDSVCLTQGDHFFFCNMNPFFKSSALADTLVITEHFNNTNSTEDLYALQEKVIERGRVSLTDQLIFANKKYKFIFDNVAKGMDEPKLPGHNPDEVHPIIILNNTIKENVSFDDIIPLERNIWTWQKGIWHMKLRLGKDCILNDRNIRIRGIHNRWWQKGRVTGELNRVAPTTDCTIFKHNTNLIRDFMSKFNDMVPDIKVTNHETMKW